VRAIRGVVTKVVNSILTIKLENGLVIELPHNKVVFGDMIKRGSPGIFIT